MSLISCNSISASWEGRTLYSDVSISIHEGEAIALIGANGAGKTTLLKQIAGFAKPDDGERAQRKDLRIGYVDQTPNFDPAHAVRQVVASALADVPLSPMETDVEREVRVAIMLDRMGFGDSEQAVGTLSGGWKKRLAIACALVAEPEVLFLDEPTNHLDLDGVLWLEQTLGQADYAFVVISHDRVFLQRVAKRVIELDPRYPGSTLDVKGDYADFVEKREQTLDHRERTLASMENKVRYEVAYLKRGPKARTSKSRSRVDAAEAAIDTLEKMKNVGVGKQGDMTFSATGRRSKKLLAAQGISKTLGDKPLFTDLDFLLSPGMRLGVVGENGSGKTTLLRVLADELQPDSGSLNPAPQLDIVYFDQSREQLDMSQTLRVALADKGNHVVYQGREQHVVTWARRFRFRSEQLDMPLSGLSGGEQAKVLIARLMLKPADLLVLDEPTNDLDIHTLEVLEESLMGFPGAVVLVTHDRYLLDRVATQLVGLDGKGGAIRFADVHQWLESRKMAAEPVTVPKTERKPKPQKPNRPRGLTYMEQKEYETIEDDIQSAEMTLEAAESHLADPAIAADADKLGEAFASKQAAQDEVERLYARWEELEAKRNGEA